MGHEKFSTAGSMEYYTQYTDDSPELIFKFLNNLKMQCVV